MMGVILYSGREKSWKLWKIALDNFDAPLYNNNSWHVEQGRLESLTVAPYAPWKLNNVYACEFIYGCAVCIGFIWVDVCIIVTVGWWFVTGWLVMMYGIAVNELAWITLEI